MGAAVAAASASDQDFVPASMDELAEHYYDYIVRQVRKYGIPAQDALDTADYIIQQLIRTGALDQYDPEHLTEHQGRQVRSRFSTFLTAKIELYCRGERGRLGKRAAHELLIMDAPAEDGGGIGDLLGAAWDDHSAAEAEEFITWMCARLAEVPPRSSRDTCDLPGLFREVARQVSETGTVSYAPIQKRFGISGTTAGAWLSRLRQVMKPILGRPLTVVGGVSLDLDQVTAAVKILREAPGVMVKQPLEKAGHPLAAAEKGWYHLFSAEEIRKFPSLAIEPGSRRKPAGHVKEAVIHRLERILAEAGSRPVQPPDREPDPEPEVTAEEQFEAFAWRYVPDVCVMEQLKELAQAAYAAVAPA